jgi:hypothetical protein
MQRMLKETPEALREKFLEKSTRRDVSRLMMMMFVGAKTSITQLVNHLIRCWWAACRHGKSVSWRCVKTGLPSTPSTDCDAPAAPRLLREHASVPPDSHTSDRVLRNRNPTLSNCHSQTQVPSATDIIP